MNSSEATPADARMYHRAVLVLTTLTLGTLPAWLLAALGPQLDWGAALRWVFLLASPVLTGALLLLAIRATACDPAPSVGRRMNLAATLLVVFLIALALPLVVFPRLPPATGRLVGLSRQPAAVLSRDAMGQSHPRQRVEAALALYLQTGRPVMYLDRSGRPAIFQPAPPEARSLRLPRWLATRPGALSNERRFLALADLVLILSVLAGLPLALRRHHSGSPGTNADS